MAVCCGEMGVEGRGSGCGKGGRTVTVAIVKRHTRIVECTIVGRITSTCAIRRGRKFFHRRAHFARPNIPNPQAKERRRERENATSSNMITNQRFLFIIFFFDSHLWWNHHVPWFLCSRSYDFFHYFFCFFFWHVCYAFVCVCVAWQWQPTVDIDWGTIFWCPYVQNMGELVVEKVCAFVNKKTKRMYCSLNREQEPPKWWTLLPSLSLSFLGFGFLYFSTMWTNLFGLVTNASYGFEIGIVEWFHPTQNVPLEGWVLRSTIRMCLWWIDGWKVVLGFFAFVLLPDTFKVPWWRTGTGNSGKCKGSRLTHESLTTGRKGFE